MSAPGSAPGARIELVRTGPDRPWLGQLVPIEVNVWRPAGDHPLEPFSLDDVVAAGMIAKWSEVVPPPDEKQQGEQRFLVQHRTLLVFPQSDGELTVPPVVARWTDASTKTNAFTSSGELRFTAAVPPGVGDTLPLVASSAVLEQNFDRALSGLRVGDGFSRTLTLRAADSDPVVFPELLLAPATGLRTYPGAVHAATTSERGKVGGEVTLRVTYVVERVGPHQLAGLSIRWLEPRSGQYRAAAVPDLTLWAAPNPSLGFQCLGTTHGTALATEAGSIVSLALLAIAVIRRIRGGRSRLEIALAKRSRERRAFRAALHAVKTAAGLPALRGIYAWLAIRFQESVDRTLVPLANATPEAQQSLTNFEQQLFREGKSDGPPNSFVPMLRRARGAMGRAHQKEALRSLNPVSAGKGDS